MSSSEESQTCNRNKKTERTSVEDIQRHHQQHLDCHNMPIEDKITAK